RQSDGEVQISSVEGEGTRVAMLLPVARQPHAAATDADNGRPAEPTHRTTPGLHILVVEDDQRVLTATVDAVQELGHRAVACGNPLDAESLVEQHGGFDLVL